MKFNYARPMLVYLFLFFWVGTGAMYYSQYLMAEQNLSPFVMGGILIGVVVMATVTHKALTRTHLLLVGNELSEFDRKGRLVRTISIDDETSIFLKPDPNFKLRTICEVHRGTDLISAKSSLHRFDDYIIGLGKIRPIVVDASEINPD